ncbi:ABC transporter ATP-binding protein [Massilibacteroides sp.]|uniref:ABC transporter ATP-binding protein n=1 Tax=Massilibacteroides sp. TaxID=2034766 RepID=UPI002636A8BF|nr:ABC transporter ATP-binding protein [Massilibacteroides sp.]MDD4515701.1 ABC transporter ATP-binding protein [Massilibacteroides sp.]
MIECNELTFSYSQKQKVLDNINLILQPGHIYGLLGKNGEGKSTLLKLICGLLIPDRGACRLWNQDVKYRPVELLQKLFLVQEKPEFPDVRVNEYFTMYAPFYPSFNNEILKTCMEYFEIDHTKRIKKLSHGQQKKVLITMALAANTPILLFDEPTNGLDIPSKKIFRQLLASFVREEQIVILSTHQVRDLDSLIDSVIIMDKGKIAYNDSLDNCSTSLESLFEEIIVTPQLKV